MELGELEFKPGDLDSRHIEDKANQILREKLAKAPEITGLVSEGEFFVPDYDGSPNTHRARLICIEEIKK